MKKFRLTAANYYSTEANQAYFSASQIKSFCSCEARALAEINGEYVRPETTALLVGSFYDAAMGGKKSFELFKSEHPELFKKDGTLKAEFVKAEQMVARAKEDPVFREFGKGRRQAIVTGTLFGYPFKAKLDILKIRGDGEHRIVDDKTCRDFNPMYKEGEGRLNFARYYQYDLQMAIYQALVEQKFGEKLPTYLRCVTKEDPPDLMVVKIEQKTLDIELEMLRYKIERFAGIKAGVIQPERCNRCPYCRATNKLKGPISMEYLDIMALGGNTDE
jgi:hypothetical protein